MEIFLSHSGEPSRRLAYFLRDWLPKVNPAFHPWLDVQNLEPGKQWSPELREALQRSPVGVICITKENAHKPWPIAEFSCLWLDDQKVAIPFLSAGATDDHLPGPMKGITPTRDSKESVRKLVLDLSQRASPRPLTSSQTQQIHSQFDQNWPSLETLLQKLVQDAPYELELKDDAPGTLREKLDRAKKQIPKDREITFFQVLIRYARLNPSATAMLLLLGVLTVAAAVDNVINLLSEPPATEPSLPPVQQPDPAIPQLESRIGELLSSNSALITLLSNSISFDDLARSYTRNDLIPKPITVLTNIVAPDTSGLAGELARLKSNIFPRLPTDQLNILDFSQAVDAPPRMGNLLVFLPLKTQTEIPLISADQPESPSGSLGFGKVYRLAADPNGNQLILQNAAQTGPRLILNNWRANPGFHLLVLTTNGVRIPGWEFLKSPSSSRPSPVRNVRLE